MKISIKELEKALTLLRKESPNESIRFESHYGNDSKIEIVATDLSGKVLRITLYDEEKAKKLPEVTRIDRL